MGFGRDVIVLVLGLVHPIQDFFSGLAGQFGDIGQTALGIRQLFRTATELFGHSQLTQRVVQLACQLADLVMDIGAFRLTGPLGGVAGFHGHCSPVFLRMWISLSSSVALVNGLTM